VFGKILEALYFKIFVNIVTNRSKTIVYIEKHSRKELLASDEKEFSTLECDEAMYKFITAHTLESPYYYISVLDMSHSQGALPTCSKERIKFYVTIDDGEYKCINNWTYYTEKENIIEIKRRYSCVGVDYIFSPFVLLSHFFKDKIDTKFAMYILVQEGFLSLAVFENAQLLYGAHLDMVKEDDFNGIGIEEEDDGEDLFLDDVDEGDDESSELEDFANIEDLDSLDDIDEFSDSKDMDEELLESTETLEAPDEKSFNEDYERFTLIQESVGEFYKDPRFESKFIENVYIADSVGVTSDFKKYLEEEMFFNVYIRRIDLALELCEVAKREQKL